MEKLLIIVPARAGSKGIPFKNLLKIDGKSLIGHAITVAFDSNLNVDVVLSSESDQILKEGLKYGARLHKRPEILATDTATTIAVVEDVMNTVKYIPELVIVLQPTSPLRTKENLIESILLVRNSNCDSLISVCETDNEILKSFCINNKGYAEGIYTDAAPFMPRQALPKVYKANGAIFITKPSVIQKKKSLYGDNLLPYIMSKETSIDIDGPEDLIGMNFKLFKE